MVKANHALSNSAQGKKQTSRNDHAMQQTVSLTRDSVEKNHNNALTTRKRHSVTTVGYPKGVSWFFRSPLSNTRIKIEKNYLTL